MGCTETFFAIIQSLLGLLGLVIASIAAYFAYKAFMAQSSQMEILKDERTESLVNAQRLRLQNCPHFFVLRWGSVRAPDCRIENGPLGDLPLPSKKLLLRGFGELGDFLNDEFWLIVRNENRAVKVLNLVVKDLNPHSKRDLGMYPILSEPGTDDEKFRDCYAIRYRSQGIEDLGSKIEFSIRFETDSGWEDVHVYRTKVGARDIVRINPASLNQENIVE